MKIEPTSARDIFGSLAFRLLALLTIALTPIGAIAVYQNSVLSKEVSNRASDELLNDTASAVSDVRRLFESAFGAAEALGRTSSTLTSSPAACTRLFQRFVGERDQYSFAGILPANGRITCSSMVEELDASADDRLDAIFEDAKPFVSAIPNGTASGRPVIMIGHPVFESGALRHFVVVSIPRKRLYEDDPRFEETGALSITTYNNNGQVLLTSDFVDSLTSRPANRALSELTRQGGVVFSDETQDGEKRVYSAVPIYGSFVYAIAGWPPSMIASPSPLAVWLFPVVMWLATLGVTYLALNRLVIRHVRMLGRQMRRFARNRTLPELGVDDDQPAEILAMHTTFRSMAEEILQDEAELENAIHEKNGLIREVHHRVKNNLQLIASIMNMQIRKSRNSETSMVVRRLQDRVLGLAAIHRQMYQAQSMADIPVDRLLDEALRQTINLDPSGKISYTRELVPLHLNSDQAVPLALLASEATLNAVKYVSADEGERPWIQVELKHLEDDQYELNVANSKARAAPAASQSDEAQATGLGTQLMRAFASQLEGRLAVEDDEGVFRVTLTFNAKEIEAEFLPPTNDNLSINTY